MEVKLDGRVALVTGGSTGLGLAIAVRMAASGADVAMLARRADVLEEVRATVEATTGAGSTSFLAMCRGWTK